MIEKLQRFLKYSASMKSVNKMDPITLESPLPPIFYFIQEENIIYRYGSRALATYLIKSGKRQDPCSQIEYNKIELGRLEKITGVIFDEPKEDIQDDGLIRYFEHEVGELLGEILDHTYEINNDGNVTLYDNNKWFVLIQTLIEIKNISFIEFKSIVSHINIRVSHEYKKLRKKLDYYKFMGNCSINIDFIPNEEGQLMKVLNTESITELFESGIIEIKLYTKILEELNIILDRESNISILENSQLYNSSLYTILNMVSNYRNPLIVNIRDDTTDDDYSDNDNNINIDNGEDVDDIDDDIDETTYFGDEIEETAYFEDDTE